MEFQDYIKPELLVLIPVLYIIGMFLKNSTVIKDKHIPLLLGAISIILSGIYVTASCECSDFRSILSMIFTIITQGILAAGASVYCNQLVKQSKKDE